MSEFKAIAAVAENGVIGSGLSIPWHISEDFKHFKKTTLGGIVAMGRRTWESLGCKPLPNRENVVITSRPEEIAGGARAFRSLDELARVLRRRPPHALDCRRRKALRNRPRLLLRTRHKPRENVSAGRRVLPEIRRQIQGFRNYFEPPAVRRCQICEKEVIWNFSY